MSIPSLLILLLSPLVSLLLLTSLLFPLSLSLFQLGVVGIWWEYSEQVQSIVSVVCAVNSLRGEREREREREREVGSSRGEARVPRERDLVSALLIIPDVFSTKSSVVHVRYTEYQSIVPWQRTLTSRDDGSSTTSPLSVFSLHERERERERETRWRGESERERV